MDKHMNTVLESIFESFSSTMPIIRRKLLKFDHSSLGEETCPPQIMIMKAINKYGVMPVSTIGQHIAVSKSEMTHHTDKLCEKGLIERQPDVSDRRIINLTLTPKGIQAVEETKKIMISTLKDRLSQLKLEELNELADTLDNLKKIILKIDWKENTE